MIGVVSLLAFVLIALLVTRVATVALRTTGLSHETARFQARSAFSGVGFTTTESEDIVNHPVRRNIVLGLMLLSTGGVVTSISALLLSFVNTSGYQPLLRATIILAGLVVLWVLASSDWVEGRLSQLIERVLTRWTDLDVHDYVRLLEISGDYSITEFTVDADEWLCGRRVGDVQLAKEGVVVLGIRRRDGHYVGVPPTGTPFEAGDTLVVYGRSTGMYELQDRKAGASGDAAHERAITEHSRVVAEHVAV
ncbi:MAG TPA: TrkA C-terminal domain-containing protein [Acidimicrobiia bacterium]|nr:TrkA C-terminal domain-containing protein [Acidimicrobiia bacterium]